MNLPVSCVVLAALSLATPALAQTPPLAPRDVPAKTIPAPATVSPGLQAIIAQPLRTGWNTPPTTPDGCSRLADTTLATLKPLAAAMAERLHVRIEPDTIDGVKTYRLTPETVSPGNARRLLIHVHGSCYVLNPHEAALPEAVMMAGLSRSRVIAVDYRMSPRPTSPPPSMTR